MSIFQDMSFEIHPQLLKDTLYIGDTSLSKLLLMNDSRFPWVILLPRKNNLREIYELNSTEQGILMSEITLISKAMQSLFSADKMNVAALGNQVPQLHIHIIARKKTDPAWPLPVWGRNDAIPYSVLESGKIIHDILSHPHLFKAFDNKK